MIFKKAALFLALSEWIGRFSNTNTYAARINSPTKIFEHELSNNALGVLEHAGRVFVTSSEASGEAYLHRFNLAGEQERVVGLGPIRDSAPLAALNETALTFVVGEYIVAYDVNTMERLWSNRPPLLSNTWGIENLSGCYPMVLSEGAGGGAIFTYNVYGSGVLQEHRMERVTESGDTVWTVDLGQETKFASCPIVNAQESVVYYTVHGNVGDRCKIHAVDAMTGNRLYQTIVPPNHIHSSMQGRDCSPPVLSNDGNTLYQYYLNGNIYSFDISNSTGDLTNTTGPSSVDITNVALEDGAGGMRYNPLITQDGQSIVAGGANLPTSAGDFSYLRRFSDLSTGILTETQALLPFEDEEELEVPMVQSPNGDTIFMLTYRRGKGHRLSGFPTADFNLSSFDAWGSTVWNESSVYATQLHLNDQSNRLYVSLSDIYREESMGFVSAFVADQATVSPAPTFPLPTAAPTISMPPSTFPSQSPSRLPTTLPSQSPSRLPSEVGSDTPTMMPSTTPSTAPTNMPSVSPTQAPTTSSAPSISPPTSTPTGSPVTDSPTGAASGLTNSGDLVSALFILLSMFWGAW